MVGSVDVRIILDGKEIGACRQRRSDDRPKHGGPPDQIHTWRDGPVVRTQVWYRGAWRSLGWTIDCFTHRGARRKARRTMARWDRQEEPLVVHR